MVTCKNCGSARIANIRLDSDWYSGGDFTPANEAGALEPDPRA